MMEAMLTHQTGQAISNQPRGGHSFPFQFRLSFWTGRGLHANYQFAKPKMGISRVNGEKVAAGVMPFG
jgi:hypothetical protein